MAIRPARPTAFGPTAVVIFVLMLVLAACSGGTGESAATTTSPSPDADADATSPASAPASAEESQTAEVLPIRVGWQPDPNAPLYVAREQGLFEKHGLDPEFVTFQAAPPMFAALQSEDVDVADMGAVPYTIALSQGIELEFLMIAVDVSDTNAVVAREGVEAFSELAGQRVATTRGSSPYLLLLTLLEQEGMSIDDIQFIDMQVSNMVPAWEARDVDAIMAWAPWIYRMEGGHIVTTMADVGLYAPQLWAARSLWADENAEAAERFVAVITEALEIVNDDPEAAQEAMMVHLEIDEELAATLYEANLYPTASEQLDEESPTTMATDDGLSQALQTIADLLYENGFIEQQPDVAATRNATFLENAASE